jgi:hypothetical protein
MNQLCPTLRRENWTAREDEILVEKHSSIGNAWAKIAAFLPGRAANSVKNRWCWLLRHDFERDKEKEEEMERNGPPMVKPVDPFEQEEDDFVWI